MLFSVISLFCTVCEMGIRIRNGSTVCEMGTPYARCLVYSKLGNSKKLLVLHGKFGDEYLTEGRER